MLRRFGQTVRAQELFGEMSMSLQVTQIWCEGQETERNYQGLRNQNLPGWLDFASPVFEPPVPASAPR